MHPAESIRSAKSRALEGRRIVLGITGSIAAVESFELARELIRHGAEVQAVMTEEAIKLVTPEAIAFATGREVITSLDWRTQHVALFGDYPDKADLLLIAPCTANTLSKMALGIDDTPVTTMATVAIGSKAPILVAPAMHLSMFTHPIVQQNMRTLKDLGLTIISQRAAKIDKSVLSQCNTQMILKVTNPNDLKAITASVEGLTSGMADEIQRLPIGVAIIVGANIQMPLFVEVRPRESKHGGESVEIIPSKDE